MNRLPLSGLLLLAITACAPAVMRGDALPALANVARPMPGVVSAGRLLPADIAVLDKAGVRQVIDLTVDSETPDFDERARVKAAGMRYENLPIAGPHDLTRENVARFDRLLRDARRPVVVHCASSNRVGAMAALRAAWIDGQPVERAIAEGRRWGLKGLEPAVRERLAGNDAAAPVNP
ncbi:MAG: hypothetical protein EPO46_01135 [Lysobacter sp.]|nr:MAG: hypothetical protein EPO46_01135 [Lysobacter sp.]